MFNRSNHYKFDINKIHITSEKMYRAAAHMGGKVYVDKEGISHSINMPARFTRPYKEMYFAVPRNINILWYGNDALAFEMLQDDDGNIKTSELQANIDHMKENIEGTWYFDGVLIYSLDHVNPSDDKIHSTDFFRKVRIGTFNPTNLFLERFVHDSYSYYDGIICKNIISPPLWAEMERLAQRGESASTLLLDAIDEHHVINLQGLLKICELTSDLFGEQSIECFDLPSYMIYHKTVNLPSLSKSVKKTSPSGLLFSSMLAFMMGKFSKSDSYEHIKQLKVMIKFIGGHCIVSKTALDNSEIFVDGEIPKVIALEGEL